MHLPDHYLDPMTTAATALISGGAVTYALFRVRHEAAAKIVPVAATGAVIFAAQMVNFPITSGTSGHLVGGALAGILLGPWAGLIAMASVLALQAIVFGDGGIAALGANVLNMGVIGVSVGTACRAVPLFRHGTRIHHAIAAAIAGWFSVALAALACALEMTISGTAAVADVVPAMVGVHALIGLPEAAISAAVVALAGYAVSPHAMYPLYANRVFGGSNPSRSNGRLGTWAFTIAVVLIGVSPFASTLPDGLERVAADLQLPDHDTTE